MTISVVLPTHPARVRNGMTKRAVGSVLSQTRPASAIIVEQDLDRHGAAITRNRGLQKVTTPWVAFLDSDDQFKPQHLELLAKCANETDADYVFSWYEAVGFVSDPIPHFGKVFDPENPTHTTITTLVRTELAQEVGFLDSLTPQESEASNEDMLFTLGCIRMGAKIVHLPQRTWLWNFHGNNTSGHPTKGDARFQ